MDFNQIRLSVKPARPGGFSFLMGIGLMVIGLGLSSCASVSVSKNLPPATSEGKSLAARVQQESNRVRSAAGLRALPSNSALATAAETQARFLVANVPLGAAMSNSIVHYDFPARSVSVMQANSMSLTAEIVVAMPPGQASPSAILAAWLGSSGHRAKLLGSWDLTGTGAAKASNGTWYVVQWFANSRR